MKKQIDPNLNSSSNDDILSSVSFGNGNKAHNGELDFADGYDTGMPEEEPDYKVTISDKVGTVKGIKQKTSEDILNELRSDNEHHHHHHHHHSDHSENHHHHSSGSHHHKKKKRKLSTPVKIILTVLIILLLIVFVITATFLYLKHSGESDLKPTITDNTEYQEIIEYNGHSYKYNEDVFSLAFIGVDQEELKSSDETEYVGAADTDIVIAVDTNTGKTSAIAIPRDTMVDVDVYSENGIFLRTENTYLCLAYAYGDGAEKSCRNSVNAMSRVLYNVPINKYYALDLNGIAPLNDAIGGVTLSSLYNFKEQGINVGDTVTLKGDMAVTYLRHRDMDNVNASLNRVDRQVQYIKTYAQQLAPAVMEDFSVVSTLYSTAKKYSRTNLTLNNATYMASFLLSKGIDSFDTYTLTGKMTESEVIDEYGSVHAQFTPDEDYLMETVLSVFYTQID